MRQAFVSPLVVLQPILFRFGPNSHVATLIDLNMDEIRAAADRTILDVLLAFTSRQVHRNHDLLATGIAYVGGVLPRSSSFLAFHDSLRRADHASQ